MGSVSEILGRLLTVVALLVCLVPLETLAQEESTHSSRIRLRYLPADSPNLGSPAEVSRWVTESLHSQLGLAPSDRLSVADDARPLGNALVYTIHQKKGDIPIVYMESRLTLDQNRRPTHLIGEHMGFRHVPSGQPILDRQRAVAAVNALGGYESEGRLVFWPDGNELKLSYEVDGLFLDGSGAFERVYVDAHSGGILERLPLQFEGLDRRIHHWDAACVSQSDVGLNPDEAPWWMSRIVLLNAMVDISKGHDPFASLYKMINSGQFDKLLVSGLLYEVSIEEFRVLRAAMIVTFERAFHRLLIAMQNNRITRNEGSNSSGNRSVDYAFELFGEFYEYISSTMSMDSIDNEGHFLLGIVGVHLDGDGIRCSGGDFNAFWAGSLGVVVFPDEALSLVEVVGHEFGHGVISNGSGLIYENESGALNEAIADAIGVGFRIWLENDGDLARNPRNEFWRMRGVERDLRNPSLFLTPLKKPYPDHYSKLVRTTRDHGGVHWNSSIINQAFYLLTTGGSHPMRNGGPNVPGIGLRKALNIFAKAAALQLTPRADFREAREAFAIVAESLYGKPEWVATHTAMDAVGIPGRWQVPTPPKPKPQPKPTTVPAPKPTTVPAPKPTTVPAPKPTTVPAPKPTTVPAPKPEVSDSSPTTPLFVAGVAVLLIAGAFVALRSNRVRSNGTTAVLVPNGTSGGRPYGAESAGVLEPRPPPIGGTAVASLVPKDGSASIALYSDLLESQEGLVIGRASELCHVEIRDPGISRRHARLRIGNGKLLIEDLNSSDGTELNGKAVSPFEPRRVRPGQFVRLGSGVYQFRLN